MLSSFLKSFSQAATSQGYFPKWKLPKCAIFQAATSQVWPSHSTQPPSPSQPQCCLQRLRWPNLITGKLPLGKMAHLGNCYLGNCHLGCRPWENAYEIVPNTENVIQALCNSNFIFCKFSFLQLCNISTLTEDTIHLYSLNL